MCACVCLLTRVAVDAVGAAFAAAAGQTTVNVFFKRKIFRGELGPKGALKKEARCRRRRRRRRRNRRRRRRRLRLQNL
jgi:hypothetical protein